MTIKEVQKLLHAQVVSGSELVDKEVQVGCGSDLMSDVLAFVDHQDGVLLTGLLNPQVVRTADMLDMCCIVFVRGKVPDESMISLANQRGIVLLTTESRLFSACGILYTAGLRGGRND